VALKFPPAWRFRPPKDNTWATERIPSDAVDEFLGMIRKVAAQGDLQDFLEHFKDFFSAANGNPHYRSSNAGWADTDLQAAMLAVAENAPLFLEAYFVACESLRGKDEDLFAPDAAMINEICWKHGIGYEIEPPYLKPRDSNATVVPVPERPPTLAEKAREVLQSSLQRAEQLLIEGHGREAVQESLWLLESVATAFRGLETETGTIEGKYFNTIVKELRGSHSGKTLDMILGWATNIHGYLSSPTGGGVRHGLDLRAGLDLTPNEARLFCNLVRSYLSYLLSEHERLTEKTMNKSGSYSF